MWRRASSRFPNRHSSFVSFLLCCRVLKPPGGGSSNLFGSAEEVSSSSKPHRMASNIFGASEEPQNLPKRTNPPGKGSQGPVEVTHRVKRQEVQQLRVFPRMEGHRYGLLSCWCSAQMSICTLCMNCTWMLACGFLWSLPSPPSDLDTHW